MAPPAFNDLGKQARDLFNKHYRKDKSITFKIRKKVDDVFVSQRYNFNSKTLVQLNCNYLAVSTMVLLRLCAIQLYCY